MFYTRSERIDKKYTVEDAIKAAVSVLEGKADLCTDALHVKRLHRSDKLTLVELNDLSELLVSDSRFYATNKGTS